MRHRLIAYIFEVCAIVKCTIISASCLYVGLAFSSQSVSAIGNISHTKSLVNLQTYNIYKCTFKHNVSFIVNSIQMCVRMFHFQYYCKIPNLCVCVLPTHSFIGMSQQWLCWKHYSQCICAMCIVLHADGTFQMDTTAGLIGPRLTLLAWNICQHFQLTETYAPLFVVIFFRPYENLGKRCRKFMVSFGLCQHFIVTCVYQNAYPFTLCCTTMHACMQIWNDTWYKKEIRTSHTYIHFNECQEEEEQTQTFYIIQKVYFNQYTTIENGCVCNKVNRLKWHYAERERNGKLYARDQHYHHDIVL